MQAGCPSGLAQQPLPSLLCSRYVLSAVVSCSNSLYSLLSSIGKVEADDARSNAIIARYVAFLVATVCFSSFLWTHSQHEHELVPYYIAMMASDKQDDCYVAYLRTIVINSERKLCLERASAVCLIDVFEYSHPRSGLMPVSSHFAQPISYASTRHPRLAKSMQMTLCSLFYLPSWL